MSDADASLMGAEKDVSADGMPAISRAEKDAAWGSTVKVIFVAPVVAAGIGFGIAYGLYSTQDTAQVTAKISALAVAGGHYQLLSGYVFTRMVSFLNFYPMLYKSQVMRASSGNLRANMLVYEQIGESANHGKVVLVEGGDLGRYNRANRSLNHFVETGTPVIIGVALVGSIFPLPVFGLTVLFALGRVAHQVGYSSQKGYGAHGIGFMFATLAVEAMGGLMLLAGLKGAGVF